jgi:quinol monooxygenase YgiN
MDTQVTVVAQVVAKEGKESELKEMLLSLIEPSRSDEGCINYDLHQSTNDTTMFMFHENWVSEELLEKHLATPHLQEFIKQSEDLLAKPLDVSLWKVV